MKQLNVSIVYEMVGMSSIMVPDELSLEEAIEYAKEHISEIPTPNRNESDWICDSDEVDEENCDFDDEYDGDDEDEDCETKISSLIELCEYIQYGGMLEELDEIGDCECIENQVYEDDDLYEFLVKLGVHSDKIDFTENHIEISDGKTTLRIPKRDFMNRHDPECGDETILFFDKMELVSK